MMTSSLSVDCLVEKLFICRACSCVSNQFRGKTSSAGGEDILLHEQRKY